MRNRWDDAPLDGAGPLAECVHGSRLLGSDPSLVLHGGGNTSVKASWEDITGGGVETLYVKGSGWDLATIEPAGFTPLRLSRLHQLLDLDSMSDPAMMAELAAAKLDPSAPAPSVETLLHAFLPYPAVQHSHADLLIALTNTEEGERLVRQVYGDSVVVIPYVMPGFDLAAAAAEIWESQAHAGTVGMVLLNHGLFTFAHTTEEAYRRHVELITAAERYLDSHAPASGLLEAPELPAPDRVELAGLRHRLSEAAGGPLIVSRHAGPAVSWFVSRADLSSVAARGPLTPDHVIRTKRLPLVGRDVEGYAASYEEYYRRNVHRARTATQMLDPGPRVVLDPEWGMLTAGASAAEADMVADIYHHTIAIISRSEALGGYRALGEGELFDVEYWDLEQAKLRRGGAAPPMSGRVAVVTGAASGIGRACVTVLLDRGAAVVGIDRAGGVTEVSEAPGYLGLVADVTEPGAVSAALDAGVERFGGVDMAVVAAGAFGVSAPIAELEPDSWRALMAVNVDSVADLLSRLHPLVSLSAGPASVVVIGSKNVAAPGPGAAAYSASKAALTQLARVAALEWAAAGIRVNVVHPDAVFDTGLWTPELLAERAARYGMDVEDYKRRNLLHTEVTSRAVAEVVAELCSERFAATTGAQIPVDGGNERVI